MVLSTMKFCSRQTPHGRMQTAIPYGTPPKRWKSNGTPSLQGGGCLPFQERYHPVSYTHLPSRRTTPGRTGFCTAAVAGHRKKHISRQIKPPCSGAVSYTHLSPCRCRCSVCDLRHYPIRESAGRGNRTSRRNDKHSS